MNIIRTDIVSPEQDVFWDDISPLVAGAEAKPAYRTGRPVLILVNTYTPGSREETQLYKMLDACGLKQDQYNIIRLTDGQKAAWRHLREPLKPKIIFLIGITPAQLGISALFQMNAPNNFNDRIWLPTVSINELEQHADIKKQLWINGMKPVFVDKVVSRES